MRVIIAGSRTVTEEQVRAALEGCSWIGFVSAVVSGTAKGADEFGETWAHEYGIQVIRYPAEWKKYGKRAGPLRNKVMADNAEGLVAVWDGTSRGTHSMISLASERGLRISILRTDLGRIEELSPKGLLENLWEWAEEKAGILEYDARLSRAQAERDAGMMAVNSINSMSH